MSILTASLKKKIQGAGTSYSGISVAVCVPTRDMMHAVFAYSLAELMAYNATKGIRTTLHFNMGTLIINQRETLVNQALEIGATHLLWLDSDMQFPKDTAERLLAHNLPVVAANYVTRRTPFKTVAYTRIHDWRSYLVHNDDTNATGLTEVAGVGMGVMLESLGIYGQLDKPWYQLEYVASSDDHMGEDMRHCREITKNGYKVMIDNELSRKVGHVGSMAYTHNLVEPNIE